MTATAVLTVTLTGPGPRRALSAVLAPDNGGIPRGLRLTSTEEGRTVRFDIESGSPAAALSTALSLLRDIALFDEVWLLSHGKDGRSLRDSI